MLSFFLLIVIILQENTMELKFQLGLKSEFPFIVASGSAKTEAQLAKEKQEAAEQMKPKAEKQTS